MRSSRMRVRSASLRTAMSRPSNDSDPLVAASTQPSSCSSVDLPHRGPHNRDILAGLDVHRHVADRSIRPAGMGNTRRSFRASTIVMIRARASGCSDGERDSEAHRIERGHDAGCSQHGGVQGDGPRLEEEVQPLGKTGHPSQDVVEADRERAARGSAMAPPRPTSSAASHNSVAAIFRRAMPSARKAATSPRRWLTDTVSSVATSRKVNVAVVMESTSEI